MDDGLCPDEWRGASIVAGDEVIDVGPELLDAGETGGGKGIALQDGKPDLDLVEPGAVGRGEVKADVAVAGEPAIALGLVGRKVVEDDVDFLARIGRDNAVHEVEELDAPPPLLVGGRHFAGGHLEGGEQGDGAVALVLVAVPGQRRRVKFLDFMNRIVAAYPDTALHAAPHSKYELKQRIIASIDEANRYPVIHTWSYKLA